MDWKHQKFCPHTKEKRELELIKNSPRLSHQSASHYSAAFSFQSILMTPKALLWLNLVKWALDKRIRVNHVHETNITTQTCPQEPPPQQDWRLLMKKCFHAFHASPALSNSKPAGLAQPLQFFLHSFCWDRQQGRKEAKTDHSKTPKLREKPKLRKDHGTTHISTIYQRDYKGEENPHNRSVQ